MKFKAPALFALSLMLTAPATWAEDYQTGLTALRIHDAKTERPLDGYFWYPALNAEDLEMAHGNAVWQPIPVAPDAPAADGKFPLVVMSHGMFGNARNQAWLATQLVKEGYAVAAINHPGTSTFQRDPDHRRMLWERPRDISRTIDHILADPKLSSRVNSDRVFMAGHSLGGFTAVALAGGRFDGTTWDTFCSSVENELVCNILDRWDVAKTPQDRAAMQANLSDARIKGFAVFDLGGTQSFLPESLGSIETPMLVYGAPLDTGGGINLDIESRALVAKLPKDTTTYLEPVELAHFDFLGVCTENGLEILKKEEPQDAFVCAEGTEPRAAKHANIARQVITFFENH